MIPAVKPIIYLPIEYRSRELDGKLALAAKLTQAGFAVVVGQQWAMYSNFQALTPGVVLFKSQNKIHHGAMSVARQAGHLVVSLEEESLALITDESIARNCPTATYDLVDFILTTGDVEKNVHVAAGCDPRKLVVTGNPRVDVLKQSFHPLYQEAISSLTSRFGSFILINTNFGIKNSKWGSVEAIRRIEINAGSLNLNDPESVKKFDHMLAWEDQNSKMIFETVSRLSKSYPDRTLIIRPHPGENIAKVQAEYKTMANVKVIHEGAHVPWTLGSELLIHTSCTTGLEAAIAGKKASSLVTMESWVSNAFLSNKVNPVFSSVDAIVENTQALLAGREGAPTPALSNFEHFIKNISDVSSIDLITTFFKTLTFTAGELTFSPIPTPPRNPVLIEKCSIALEEMKSIMTKLSQIFAIPQTAEPGVYELGDSIFLLPPAQAQIKKN